MQASAEALSRESDALEAQLVPLRAAAGGAAPPQMSLDERIREEAFTIACYDAWASRRRAFKELWGILGEQLDMKDKAMNGLIPYEKDEANGAVFETAKATAVALTKALTKHRSEAKQAQAAAGRA